jgi:hypothetical protein
MDDDSDINVGLGKGKRFIVAPKHLGYGPNLIVLSDINYWNTHYEELKDWCDTQLGAEIVGMTIEFTNEKELMMFVLRWS